MKRNFSITFFLVVSFLAFCAPSMAQDSNDYVKTVFVFNFTRYIEWPVNGSEFVIGIFGNDQDLHQAFVNMASKKSAPGKKIVIKKLASASEVANCNILFIPEPESNQFASIRSQKLQNTLVITEKPGLGRQGSGINFILVDGKMRFEINKEVIEKSGLKVSGQLLGLGTEV